MTQILVGRRNLLAVGGLLLLGCSEEETTQGPKTPGAPAPDWQLQDFQPKSARVGEVYGLRDFGNSVVLLGLFAGWCQVCVAAAGMLNDLEKEWQSQGLNVRIVVVNDTTADTTQKPLIDVCDYPLFQDTPQVNAFAQHEGQKDDMFVYTQAATLHAYLPLLGEYDVRPNSEIGKQNLRNALIAAGA